MAGNLARGNDLGIGQGTGLKIISYASALFLIAPLLILIFFSFNSSRSITHWDGFSLQWYKVLFNDQSLWISLKNSLIIAVVSTMITTVIAVMGALLMGKYNFRGKAFFQNLLYVPVILPEIIFGVALLALFILVKMPLGILSVIFAHITFSFPFALLIILSKVLNLPPGLEEASLDLGAGRWATFKNVVLPFIMPGVVSGALFAFTLSIDDFIVTFFTAGVGASTLPLKIYAMIKFGLTPTINAISTILIVFTMVALYVSDRIQKSERIGRKTKMALGGTFLFIILMMIIMPYFQGKNNVLNIYNYSDYLDENLIREFEQESGIKVNVDYYNDNEELLAKMQMGVSGYDLIFPTGYMVKIMKDQGFIQPIDFTNIPNYANITPSLRKLDYDTTGNFYIPYAYGFTGIVYNSDYVKDTINSWRDLWNPKYKGNILMLDDMREAFWVASKLIGKPFDGDSLMLRESLELLKTQKPLLKKYESNSVVEILKSGDAWIAQAWNGIIDKLASSDPKFRFCIPREGTLFFFDNICIPSTAPHKKNAEKFINFMLTPEHSAANMMKIRYAMPNKPAQLLLDTALQNNKVIFPAIPDLAKLEVTIDLGELNKRVDKVWTELKVY